MKLEKIKHTTCLVKNLLPIIALVVGLSNPGYAQFKENVRQSYLSVQQTSCFVLLLHWIRDTATLRNHPGWQTIHDSVLENVYEGKFDVRSYVRILELQHVAFAKKMSFGLFTSSAPLPGHTGHRKLQGEVDDIAHVDRRRQEWLQPTLYEEYLINGKELELPAPYKR